jgi:hypothetical protein
LIPSSTLPQSWRFDSGLRIFKQVRYLLCLFSSFCLLHDWLLQDRINRRIILVADVIADVPAWLFGSAVSVTEIREAVLAGVLEVKVLKAGGFDCFQIVKGASGPEC